MLMIERTREVMNIRWRAAVCMVGLCLVMTAPTLLADDVADQAGVEKETMFDLLLMGGPVMIPLGLASILALALGIERFISLKKDRVLPPDFLPGLSKAWEEDSSGKAAEVFCEKSDSPAGHIFKAAIPWRGVGYRAVGKALEDAASREVDKMKSSLRGLAVVATVSPLLGLLGTVYGMIEAFQHTAGSTGTSKPADLANGIYEALVTTAVGLTIAIPVMLMYQFLSSRVDKIVAHLGEVGSEFVAHCALAEKKEAKSDSKPAAVTGA